MQFKQKNNFRNNYSRKITVVIFYLLKKAFTGSCFFVTIFEGKRETSAGTVDYTNGEDIRPISIATNRQTSMKLEAPCFS